MSCNETDQSLECSYLGYLLLSKSINVLSSTQISMNNVFIFQSAAKSAPKSSVLCVDLIAKHMAINVDWRGQLAGVELNWLLTTKGNVKTVLTYNLLN